ncbi:hypothetical protein [uncultured Microbacterium sp.]|uniref:hypothetical protein n=1 Tax=uncultured Microbacterium sp. TaxID=191216 RepID=UPI0025D0B990|nr:hypothetical protein [uncultured Microbacterium sp.]
MNDAFRDREHFVLAGVVSDAPFLNRLLAALPANGYGQVFVESTGQPTLLSWPGPADVVPFWARQDLAPARDGRLPQPGEVLADVLRAWVAEWLPEPGCDDVLPYTMWIGAAGHPPVDALCRELARDYPWLHLHHPVTVAAQD